MYIRLQDYFSKFCLITENQFGFRRNHSTYMPLTIIYSKISVAIDSGKYSVGVFLDLEKAYDTVNHDILLRKIDEDSQ